ncbi:MAG: hypothetical protein M3H12_09040 [Chromatiales bacterium]
MIDHRPDISFKPLFVKEGQRPLKTNEGKTEMNLARAQGEALRGPPLVQRQIDVTLLRPATELTDQAALSRAGRPGDQQLPKSDMPWEGDTLYYLYIVEGSSFKRHRCRHVEAAAGYR